MSLVVSLLLMTLHLILSPCKHNWRRSPSQTHVHPYLKYTEYEGIRRRKEKKEKAAVEEERKNTGLKAFSFSFLSRRSLASRLPMSCSSTFACSISSPFRNYMLTLVAVQTDIISDGRKEDKAKKKEQGKRLITCNVVVVLERATWTVQSTATVSTAAAVAAIAATSDIRTSSSAAIMKRKRAREREKQRGKQ